MTKSVVVRSCSRLSCSNQESPDVVLCLVNTSLLASGKKTIEGVITKSYKSTGCDTGCGCSPEWTYIVAYDNTLLATPTYSLIGTDVEGIFCKGCITNWVEDLIVPLCVTDSSSIDFSLSSSCVTGAVKISADANNAISIHSDGLYAAASGGSGWGLTGNAGTDPVTNFIGTTDSVAFQIKVNSIRAGLLNPGNPAPVGFYTGEIDYLFGCPANTIDAFSTGYGNVMFGGKNSGIGDENTMSGIDVNHPTAFSGIFGGAKNALVSAYGCSILGGVNNTISQVYFSSVLAGDTNKILNTAFSFLLQDNAILSGLSNTIDQGNYSVILNGSQNQIVSTAARFNENCLIGGGTKNEITENCSSCSIFGDNNVITNGAYVCFASGYSHNMDGASECGILSGGQGEILGATESAIVSGFGNQIDASTKGVVRSAILSGSNNKLVGSSVAINYTSILGGLGLQLGDNSVGYQADTGVITPGVTYTNLSASSQIAYFGDVDIWLGNIKSTARKLKFFEPNSSLTFAGTNFSSFEAQAQAADIRYVLPAAAGAVGNSLKILSVVGTTVTLQWA